MLSIKSDRIGFPLAGDTNRMKTCVMKGQVEEITSISSSILFRGFLLSDGEFIPRTFRPGIYSPDCLPKNV